MASTTSEESMIDPSTIASGESGSTPRRWSQYSPFFSLSSTSFIAELPISRPTRPFERENSTVRSTPSPSSSPTALNVLKPTAR